MAYRKRTDAENQNVANEEMQELGSTTQKESVNEERVENIVHQPAKEEKRAEKQYKPDDLINCRSIVQGSLTFKGTKSGNNYRWDAPNDITEVEYQDLRAARVSKHAILMNAYFIIEDDDLLSLPEWAEVKEKYGKLYSRRNLTDIFRAPSTQEMVKEIRSLPDGVKAQMANIAKGLMEDGKLDSISKIKAIDTELGTNLMLFIGGEEK